MVLAIFIVKCQLKRKKMKKIINIFFVVLTVLSVTSCDDFLDITPDGQVKREELLSTSEGIEDALYGVAQRQGAIVCGGDDGYLHVSCL